MAEPKLTDDLRSLLDGLLSESRKDLRTVTTDEVFAVKHGWFMRALDSIEAALLLDDRGLVEVAAPLIRAATEHAVGIVWLSVMGEDGLRILARENWRWAKRVKEARGIANESDRTPGRVDWSEEIDEALSRVIADEIPSGTTDNHKEQKVRFRAAGAFDVYVAWLAETGYSHATQASAQAYLTIDGDRVFLLGQSRRDDNSLVMRCARLALLAASAMGKSTGSELWEAKVAQADQRFCEIWNEAHSTESTVVPEQERWLERFDRN
jgi:hypothetical protein